MNKNQKKLSDALIQIDPELIEEAALSTEVTGGRARPGIFLRVCVPAALYAVLLACATVGVLHFASPFKNPTDAPETTTDPNEIGQAILDIFKDVIWLDVPSIEIPEMSLPSIEDAIWHDVTVPPLVTLPEVDVDPPEITDPTDPPTVDPPTVETEGTPDNPETETEGGNESITLPGGVTLPGDATLPSDITLPDTLPPIEIPENITNQLNGYDINSYLNELLEKQKEQNTDDPMAVEVSKNIMDSFTYQGKTLAQWQEEIAKAQAMYEQMQQVMDALQNTQNGTMSDISGLESFGMSILNSLLNEGNFNRDTVNSLSETMHNNLSELTEGLTEFYQSYQQQYGNELSNLLKELGANVYSALTGGDSLIFATPSQLEQLTKALSDAGIDPSTLNFDLASKDVLNQLAPDMSGSTLPGDQSPSDDSSAETLDPLESWIADHLPTTSTPSYNWNNLTVEQDLLRELLTDTLNQNVTAKHSIHLEQTERDTLASFLYGGMTIADHEQAIASRKAELDEVVARYEMGDAREDDIAYAQDQIELAQLAYDNHIEAYEKLGYTGQLSRLLSELGYTVTGTTSEGVIVSATAAEIASLAEALRGRGEDSGMYLLTMPE